MIFAKQECPFSPSGNFLFLQCVQLSDAQGPSGMGSFTFQLPLGVTNEDEPEGSKKVRLGDLSPGSLPAQSPQATIVPYLKVTAPHTVASPYALSLSRF